MPVDGAPVLGPNPYVSAAASAGSAAVSLLNALSAAHNQQVRLAQQKQQQADAAMIAQRNERARLLMQGARPYQPYLEKRDASGMIQRVPNPNETGDASRVMQFPALGENMAVYIPDQGEIEDQKEKAKDKHEGKRSVSLTADLAKEAKAGGLEVDPDTPYSTSVLGEINSTLTRHDQEQRDRSKHLTPTINLTDFSDENGPAPVMIDENGNVRKLNLQEGLQAVGQASADAANGQYPGNPPREAPMPDLFGTGLNFNTQTAPKVEKPGLKFTPKPTKEPQPKSLHFEKDTNDAGDVTTSAYDPEKGTLVHAETRKGIGAKRKDPDAPAKPKPPSAAQLREVEVTKNNRLAKAAQDLRKALADSVLPEDRADAMADYRRAQQQAQLEYEAGLAAVTGHEIGHNAWADQPQQTQQNSGQSTQQKSAQSTQQKSAQANAPQKKVASRAQIRAYAAKKYGKLTPQNEAKALREFQAAQYTIQ
jgi:hypothetical protein